MIFIVGIQTTAPLPDRDGQRLQDLLQRWRAIVLRPGLYVVERDNADESDAPQMIDDLDAICGDVTAELLVLPVVHPAATLGLSEEFAKALELR